MASATSLSRVEASARPASTRIAGQANILDDWATMEEADHLRGFSRSSSPRFRMPT